MNRCRYRLRRPGGPLGRSRFGSSARDRHVAIGSRLHSVDRTIVRSYYPTGRGWSTPVGRGRHDPVCRRGDVAVTRCRFSRRRMHLLLRTARPAPGCRPDPGWLHPRRLFGARFRHIAIAVTAHRSRLSRDTVCFRNHFVTFGWLARWFQRLRCLRCHGGSWARPRESLVRRGLLFSDGAFVARLVPVGTTPDTRQPAPRRHHVRT